MKGSSVALICMSDVSELCDLMNQKAGSPEDKQSLSCCLFACGSQYFNTVAIWHF